MFHFKASQPVPLQLGQAGCQKVLRYTVGKRNVEKAQTKGC